MMASLLVLCGSSVYVQKKSRCLVSIASCSSGDMLVPLPLNLLPFLFEVDLVTVVVEGAMATSYRLASVILSKGICVERV